MLSKSDRCFLLTILHCELQAYSSQENWNTSVLWPATHCIIGKNIFFLHLDQRNKCLALWAHNGTSVTVARRTIWRLLKAHKSHTTLDPSPTQPSTHSPQNLQLTSHKTLNPIPTQTGLGIRSFPFFIKEWNDLCVLFCSF